jgi:lysyl-tRNA synthetase class 2
MSSRARQYFAERDVLEVTTPAIGTVGVTDTNIDSIPLHLNERTVYLQSSPEYFMKRLLAAGYPDIYQVCRVFREGEIGSRHQPEFTLIEWYRLGFELNEIMRDAVDLITCLLESRDLNSPQIVSYADIFFDSMSIDPMTISTEALRKSLDADQHLQQSVGDDRDAWLDLAMASRVSTDFDDNRLTVVYHYPESQASLARICPHNPSVADRFEIYLGTVELANGFVELTDADEQLRRFEQDRKVRAGKGKQDMAIDHAFIEALRTGLPDCAGVALGLDRLLMIAEGLDNIAAATTFEPGGDGVR